MAGARKDIIPAPWAPDKRRAQIVATLGDQSGVANRHRASRTRLTMDAQKRHRRSPSSESNRDMKLAGEVAVVTGAGRGIGRAIALAQAKEGAKVALLARTAAEIEAVAEEVGAEGGVARAFAADIVDLDSITKAFAAIEGDLGPVSLLTN